MSPARFAEITPRYTRLTVVLVGDFCLDRYLEIDPDRAEVSIETGLTVHNVVGVRSQPGGAGTILNNLLALGVHRVEVVGFCGEDGEGFELQRALASRAGVDTSHFLQTHERRTFTYCKPLVVRPGKPPEELNRLDSKNWSPTPSGIEDQLAAAVRNLAGSADAVVALDQVDVAGTGVITDRMREVLGEVARHRPDLVVLADSRRGLRDWPPVGFKMNAAELAALLKQPVPASGLDEIGAQAAELAARNGRPVIVTLSERGVVGALPGSPVEYVPCFPVRGPIDIVGAGDAVMANLAVALSGGASLREALELAMAAASVVIHQLGTTGTANPDQLRECLCAH